MCGHISYLLQSVLPKAATSLKVLAELPIIVVLMYQVRLTVYYITCFISRCCDNNADECRREFVSCPCMLVCYVHVCEYDMKVRPI